MVKVLLLSMLFLQSPKPVVEDNPIPPLAQMTQAKLIEILGSKELQIIQLQEYVQVLQAKITELDSKIKDSKVPAKSSKP